MQTQVRKGIDPSDYYDWEAALVYKKFASAPPDVELKQCKQGPNQGRWFWANDRDSTLFKPYFRFADGKPSLKKGPVQTDPLEYAQPLPTVSTAPPPTVPVSNTESVNLTTLLSTANRQHILVMESINGLAQRLGDGQNDILKRLMVFGERLTALEKKQAHMAEAFTVLVKSGQKIEEKKKPVLTTRSTMPSKKEEKSEKPAWKKRKVGEKKAISHSEDEIDLVDLLDADVALSDIEKDDESVNYSSDHKK